MKSPSEFSLANTLQRPWSSVAANFRPGSGLGEQEHGKEGWCAQPRGGESDEAEAGLPKRNAKLASTAQGVKG